MNRVPRPLDISWNERAVDGTIIVENRAVPRWQAWMSSAVSVLITFPVCLFLALLLTDDSWKRNSFVEFSLMALCLTAMTAWQVGNTFKQWNDRTVHLSRGAVTFSQRLQPRRRALRAEMVQRVVVQPRRWIGWDVRVQTLGDMFTLPFGFGSAAHAEYAASRIAEVTGAEYTSPALATATGGARGKAWDEVFTPEGATLRYRNIHPMQFVSFLLVGVLLVAFLVLTTWLGVGYRSMHLILALSLLHTSFAMALKARAKISPNSLKVSHPVTLRRPSVQGTIASFSVRKDFMAWTVIAITTDGNATPIGMESWKEPEARATAENLTEVLRKVRSNAATGYRVGSVAPAVRVALPDHPADPTEEASTTKQRGA